MEDIGMYYSSTITASLLIVCIQRSQFIDSTLHKQINYWEVLFILIIMISRGTYIGVLITASILTIIIIGLSIHFTLPEDKMGVEVKEKTKEENGISFVDTNMSENKDEVFKGILEVVTKTRHMVGNISTVRHLKQNNHEQKLHSISEEQHTKRVSLIIGVVIGIAIILSCTGICIITIKVWHANLVFRTNHGNHINEKNGIELFPEVKLDPEL